jgi:hypothetical protein
MREETMMPDKEVASPAQMEAIVQSLRQAQQHCAALPLGALVPVECVLDLLTLVLDLLQGDSGDA